MPSTVPSTIPPTVPSKLPSVAEVEAIIAALLPSLAIDRDGEWLPLEAAIGRVLAEAVCGAVDNPRWDNSAMDGYAVRSADLAAGEGLSLRVVDQIAAGSVPRCPIGPGEAARIFTGAMLPEGADTIVIQEDCQVEGDRVMVASRPEAGAFVRKQGAFYRAGAPLLGAGVTIGAPELALLASVQVTQVRVWRRLRVALFSTGDELRSIEATALAPGQLVDSNRPALAALLRGCGVEVIDLGIVADDREALRSRMVQAIGPQTNADLVLSSGGVSVGDYDYVDGLLAELGATIAVRSVAMRPGKPLTVATFADPSGRSRLYIGLPGNPVSSLVGFWRFVEPALALMGGRGAGVGVTEFRQRLSWRSARTEQALQGASREVYLWGTLSWQEDPEPGYRFSVAGGSHSSGNLINLGQTNGLACIPAGEGTIEAGAMLRVLRVRC
jgi:molybdopterin molybdotransferase